MMAFAYTVEAMSRRIEIGREVWVGSLDGLDVFERNQVIGIAEVQDGRAAWPPVKPIDNVLSIVAGTGCNGQRGRR